MIESFVDLTYRGLSLGRRIKLTQVRPSSGTLELPAPMPVGSHIAIVADDGVVLDATVIAVQEQVAGAERTPGMVVAPALGAEPAAAWWRARVQLPDEHRPRRTTRSRPVTARPEPVAAAKDAPPPRGVADHELPTIIADLDARVSAAAGVAPAAASTARAAGPAGGVTPAMPVDPEVTAVMPDAVAPAMPVDPEVTAVMPDAVAATPDPVAPAPPVDAEDERRTTVMNAVDQDLLEQLTRPAGEAVMRRTGEHAVVDDGNRTMIMDSVDPAALGLELTAGADAEATDPGDDGDDGAPDPGEPAAPGDPATPGGGAPAGRFKKRRKRR